MACLQEKEKPLINKESQEMSFKEKHRPAHSLTTGKCEWHTCGNCQEKPTENKIVCCQELNVLGHHLNFKSNSFFPPQKILALE